MAAAPRPTPPPSRPRWALRLGQRLRRHLLLKSVGISAFMWLFFIAYFELLRHPAQPVTTMPLTALDHWIGVQPASLVPYLSLWLYVGLAPGLLLTVRQLLVYGLWAAAMCGVGLACFHFWPTAVPPPGTDLLSHPGFMLLRGVDAAGNACPSLHVTAATFTVLRLESLLREVQSPAALRAVNACWFVLIGYSTLATKQHVVLDVLAGMLLGAIFAWGSLRWQPGTALAAYPSGYHPSPLVTRR